MYELLSYMVLMYAFYGECDTLEETGGVSVLEIFGKDHAHHVCPVFIYLKCRTFCGYIMAKLKNKYSGRLIDVWVPGNSGNNPKNFQWTKKFSILVLLIAIFIFLTTLWNYFDISFNNSTPSSNLNEYFASASAIAKPEKIIWSVATGKEPLSVAPFSDREAVYVITGQRPETSKIMALDLSNGSLLWERNLYSVADHEPVAAENLIFVAIRTGEILALNKNTGQTEWSFNSESLIRGSPVVLNGVLYLAASKVHAFDAMLGELLWEHQVGNDVSQQVTISGEVLGIVSSDGHINLVDISNGKRRMTFRLPFGNTKFPKSNPDTVVLAGIKSNVIAIDLNEKDVPMEKAIRSWWRVLWKLDLANRPPVPRGFQWWQRSLKGLSAHTLGIDDRFAFINVKDLGNQSRLVALDVSDGSLVWANQFGSDLMQGAILRAGAIIVATEYGDIHKFSIDSGRELWKFKHDSELVVSPIASEVGLIVADKNGRITALR